MRQFPRPLRDQILRVGNMLAPVSGEIDTDRNDRRRARARGTPVDGVPHHPEQLPQDRE